MENLNKKQKIIFLGMLGVMCLTIIYYLFEQWRATSQENIYETSITENQVLETQKKNIMVHITGCVEKEGVVELEENSRIADAIEKAGGTTSDADLSRVNLAYKLKDGQKIIVPSIIDDEETTIITERGEGIDTEDNKGKININTATQSELETLSRNRSINGIKNN